MEMVRVHAGAVDFDIRILKEAIALQNSNALEPFLRPAPYIRALMLSEKIRRTYHHHTGEELDVELDSMAIEIIGHVFVEDFFRDLEARIPLDILRALTDKVEAHCREINIGSKAVDRNRRFWDRITPFV